MPKANSIERQFSTRCKYLSVAICIGLASCASAQFDVNSQLDRLIAKTLEGGEPYRLDNSMAFPEADGRGFQFTNPVVFDSAFKVAQAMKSPLSPGNYAVPVIAYGLMFGQAQPGDGQQYRLGQLSGRYSKVVNQLMVLGTIKSIAPAQLNAICWRISAGIPLSEMSKGDQAVIHSLIPEYEGSLKRDFLDGIHAQYRNLSLFLGGKSFEEELESLGDNGQHAAMLYRSRRYLLAKSIKDADLPSSIFQAFLPNELFVLPKIDNPPDCPWAEIRPGIFVRPAIYDGVWKQNWLEIHVNARKKTDGAQSSPTQTVETLGDLLGMNGTRMGSPLYARSPNALVGYSANDSSTPLLFIPDFITDK